jgi:uncharacterized protein with HEPN domain
MAKFSSPARLTDIVEAIGLIRSEMADVALCSLERDRRKRRIVERGIEIISEASRSLPDELKARHPEIPWPKVAGIGNVLRHEYQGVAYCRAFFARRRVATATPVTVVGRTRRWAKNGLR